jgi:anti-sigma factor RsiW
MSDTQSQMLLQAGLDGELDASTMLLFERRLAEEPALAAEYRRLLALRQSLGKLPKTQASEAFRARMVALGSQGGGPAQEDRPPQTSRLNRTRIWLADWRPMILAASLAFILGSGASFLMLPAPGGSVTQTLVAEHIRGMIAGQVTDVASSDRHTVKPWFATRIVQAPQVVDLSAEGFTLLGGRVDVIDDKPVATLVFQRAKHVISLTELPGSRAAAGPASIHRSVKGYSVLTWTMGETAGSSTTYIAVSDIAPAELDALAAAFRKVAGSSG